MNFRPDLMVNMALTAVTAGFSDRIESWSVMVMASQPWNWRRHVTNSTPPYPSSSVPPIPSNRKSAEEVWKEIKLAPLCNCSMEMDAPPSAFRNMIGPFIKDSTAADSTFLKQAQPTTLLSLSPRSIFQKQGFDSLLFSFHNSKSSTTCPSNGEKRVQQRVHDGYSDQRRQRLIKNREAAARSRARKQAYKNELEFKLACLTEENSRLRRQLEELQLRLKFSAKPSKMRTLYRSVTSPF